MNINDSVHELLLNKILQRLVEGSDGIGGDWTVQELREYLKSIGIVEDEN